MAQVFISDSSRRPQQISEDEMQRNWDRDLPRPKQVVCNQCKQADYKNKYINGLCTKCYRVEQWHLACLINKQLNCQCNGGTVGINEQRL